MKTEDCAARLPSIRPEDAEPVIGKPLEAANGDGAALPRERAMGGLQIVN